jgi:hypothetical protein
MNEMKLLTKEIQQSVPGLYDTEDTEIEDKTCHVKFFTPWSNWTWYVVEASAICLDGDSDRPVHIPLNKFEKSINNLETEYELDDGSIVTVTDVLFFGFVQGLADEWGYFSYGELKSITGPLGLSIERDKYARTPRPLKELAGVV